VALRVIGGSQNQSLDCDPNYSNLSDELASGCRPTYSKNTGQVCPNSVSALWGSPQPWPCVAVQTGNATNQVPKGLNTRVLGDPKPNACPAAGQFGHNNWSMFPNLPAGDPRIIHVFLTPFGSFSGSGSTTVPVVNFATFYLTGWTGQGSGFNNPCQGNGDDPVPQRRARSSGHFIKYTTHSTPVAGTDLCDFHRVRQLRLGADRIEEERTMETHSGSFRQGPAPSQWRPEQLLAGSDRGVPQRYRHSVRRMRPSRCSSPSGRRRGYIGRVISARRACSRRRHCVGASSRSAFATGGDPRPNRRSRRLQGQQLTAADSSRARPRCRALTGTGAPSPSARHRSTV
jgi:hypothetical protein